MLVARRFSISSLSAAIHQDFGAQTCFITARSKLLSYDSIPACELACAASSLPPPLPSALAPSSFTVHPPLSLSLSLGNALDGSYKVQVRFVVRSLDGVNQILGAIRSGGKSVENYGRFVK